MLGHKVRDFKPLTGICLEDLVSADNFYRQVERSIDLSFVRELAAEFYSNIGRTSVDPVVFLPLVSRRTSEQVLLYKPKAEVCNACPVKRKCTGSKSGRHIFRSFFQEYLDKVETYRQSETYLKAIRKRSLWVEPLFGEAKEFHGLRRFRLRRLRKVNIEGVLVATGQNLKRLIQHHLAELFSFLKFPAQCLISPLILTFSTG